LRSTVADKLVVLGLVAFRGLAFEEILCDAVEESLGSLGLAGC